MYIAFFWNITVEYIYSMAIIYGDRWQAFVPIFPPIYFVLFLLTIAQSPAFHVLVCDGFLAVVLVTLSTDSRAVCAVLSPPGAYSTCCVCVTQKRLFRIAVLPRLCRSAAAHKPPKRVQSMDTEPQRQLLRLISCKGESHRDAQLSQVRSSQRKVGTS